MRRRSALALPTLALGLGCGGTIELGSSPHDVGPSASEGGTAPSEGGSASSDGGKGAGSGQTGDRSSMDASDATTDALPSPGDALPSSDGGDDATGTAEDSGEDASCVPGSIYCPVDDGGTDWLYAPRAPLNLEPNESQEAVSATARAFASRVLLPIAARIDETEELPVDALRQLGQATGAGANPAR